MDTSRAHPQGESPALISCETQVALSDAIKVKAPRLPPELIQRVALFLPDSITFFAFLDAYANDDDGVLGDLVSFRVLRDVTLPQHLWPQLRVNAATQTRALVHVEKVAKYFPMIEISDSVDVTALRLAPSTLVQLRVTPRSRCWPPFLNQRWSTFSSASFILPPNAKPSLIHLKDLQLDGNAQTPTTTWDVLFRYLESSNITSLSINASMQVSSVHLWHVVRWLQHCPVENVQIERWNFDDARDVLPAFYTALASCATLKALRLSEITLPNIAHTPFPTPLSAHKVQIIDCHLSQDDKHALFCGFERVTELHWTVWGTKLYNLPQYVPRLEHLELKHMMHDNMENLCESLCSAMIHTLVLTDFTATKTTIKSSMQCMRWIITYLPQWRHLKNIKLRQFCIGAAQMNSLGVALSQARTLRCLELNFKNSMDLSILAPYLGKMLLHELVIRDCRVNEFPGWTSTNSNPFEDIFASNSLYSISFRMCGLKSTDILQLKDAVVANSSIRDISLMSNRVSAADISALLNAMKNRVTSVLKLHVVLGNTPQEDITALREHAKNITRQIYSVFVDSL
ncbi:Aste57867_12149 [Aphanomyces stellatus]|uniref:Aste57867_12149 protein n=1 Tax=Aphanomyces stellatus TaxID=120398 RepID=A0A485KUS7_9STRA|nr:hypothetical protein As57867_012104 [Aphanomyces stellatus]VFT89003.1 Aste57867_12149 [Aphanomyces stellatus]